MCELNDIVKKAATSAFVEDYPSACHYYEMAALKGDMKSVHKLITYYSKEKYNLDLEKAIFWLNEYLNRYANTTNRSKYEHQLGAKYKEYYFSTHSEEAREKAVFWLNQAFEHRTEQTKTKIILSIGEQLYGLGDYENAYAILYSILPLCMEKSYHRCMAILGKCYLFGRGVKKNPGKACELLQIAAKSNSRQAKSLLSKFFKVGDFDE